MRARLRGQHEILEGIECDHCSMFAIEQDEYDGRMCPDHYNEAADADWADLQVKVAREDSRYE